MRKKFYLTLDTETATLPFVNDICATPKEKQTIAIAKPLVYDIGWTITDTQGRTIKEENYLVQETFFVPNVFNTAYYKNKRPIYMEMYNKGLIKSACWNDIINILLQDLRAVNLTTAYNAYFDFKKAIPFTERYIKNLYSSNYNEWERQQKLSCKMLLDKTNITKNEKKLTPVLELRGEEFPIADLWGLSCDRLLDNSRYKNYCLKNDLLTTSAQYFKSSAEVCFQYCAKNYDFIEDHTALSDAKIEAYILSKILKKGKIEPCIKPFPFKKLGSPIEYVKKRKKYLDNVKTALEKYMKTIDEESKYYTRLEKIYTNLN